MSKKEIKSGRSHNAGKYSGGISLWPETWDAFAVASVVILGIVVRLIYAYFIRNDILIQHLIIDASFYDKWGQQIARGNILGNAGVLYQDPLYAYFLGIIYKLWGHHVSIVRLIQIFLDAGACVFVFLSGKLLWNRYAGVFAGLLMALYGTSIVYTQLLDKTTVALFLSSFFSYLLLRIFMQPSLVLAVLSGVTFGLFSLVRGNVLLVFPFVVLLVLINSRKRWAHSLALILGILAIIGPVAARNYFMGKDFVLITANAGLNFYIGNNPRASGSYRRPAFISGIPEEEFNDSQVLAEKMQGKPLMPSQVSAFWFKQGLKFIKNNPALWLRLEWLKIVLMAKYFEVPETYSPYYFFSKIPALKVLPGFALIGCLGFAGLLFLRKQKNGLPLQIFLAGYMISVLPFFVTARYRMPIVPILTIFAGGFIVELIEQLRALDYRGVLPKVIAGLVIYSFVNTNNRVMADYIIPTSSATPYVHVAKLYLDDGKVDDAIQELKTAATYVPNDPLTHAFLGECYKQKGDVADAISAYQRALSIDPSFHVVHNNLGELYFRSGNLVEAARHFSSAYSLRPDIKEIQGNYQKVFAKLSADQKRRLVPRPSGSSQ